MHGLLLFWALKAIGGVEIIIATVKQDCKRDRDGNHCECNGLARDESQGKIDILFTQWDLTLNLYKYQSKLSISVSLKVEVLYITLPPHLVNCTNFSSCAIPYVITF